MNVITRCCRRGNNTRLVKCNFLNKYITAVTQDWVCDFNVVAHSGLLYLVDTSLVRLQVGCVLESSACAANIRRDKAKG